MDNNDYVNGSGFCCNPAGETTGSLTGKMTAKNDNAELQQFYYHPDHLGSSSYISNLDGEVVQHIEYVPFGEVFLEEKNAKWNTPYLFTSKELDRETGMYYFGARYQDPKLGIFISVDPMAGKYPNYSSYAYALNSPVNYIDPDGMDPVPITSYMFRIYANSLGIHGNQRIGSFFEKLAIASLRTTQFEVVHNQNVNFPSPARIKMNGGLPGSVRPDGTTERFGGDSEGRVFITPAFYEAKATSATITKNYRKGQITGMIDAVADLKTEVGGFSSLTLITTSNTKVSKSIKEYASQRGVMLYQSTAAIDDETGEFIISDRKWLNREGSSFGKYSVPADLIKNMFDFDNYNSYNGVNPRNYTQGITTPVNDPDPSTID